MKTFKNVEFINVKFTGIDQSEQLYELTFTDNVIIEVDIDNIENDYGVSGEIEFAINMYEDGISKAELKKAVKALNECIKQHPALTYDIHYDNDYNSMSEGFALSLSEAKDYIKSNNGTNSGYFGHFKTGDIVSIYCIETGECVYEEEIRHSDDKEEEFEGYQVQ